MNNTAFFPTNADLLGWRRRTKALDVLQPWKPVPLDHEQWPPNYKAVYAWRIKQLQRLQADDALLQGAKHYYSSRPAEFIMHWMDTYDPRQASNKWVPFVFFLKQAQVVRFLHELREDQQGGLIEKCRDAGATWIACGYSVWSWLFIPNDAIGWGSRKETLVDTLGDPDSIFEKMRLIVRRMPAVWLPSGFVTKKHATFMKLINPENGSTITGEAGDNIGRGGRKSMYFKDESAHYERPEKIESALGDNTNCQVDISSVNGLGNAFHRRREAGVDWSPGATIERGYTRIMVIDWRDHPAKNQEWYDQRRARYEREGMLHLFAQEVERNYSAAISNTIIPYEWIDAAVDAHLRIPYLADFARNVPNMWGAGLDVADEGVDKNGLTIRQSIIWRDAQEWGERDPGVSTRRAIAAVRQYRGIHVQYDCIGIGASCKSEYNSLIDRQVITRDDVQLIPWNAGAEVVDPYERVIPNDDQSPYNRDYFGNMKAQAWWSLRTRFYKTFQAVVHGTVYEIEELISLDSRMQKLHQVKKELAQPTRGTNGSLGMIVDKRPKGMPSPNLADAGMQMYFPRPINSGAVLIGKYGT